jgi:hypothetical protein
MLIKARSSRVVAAMDADNVTQPIELFMRFCNDANIDIKSPATSICKYILAYQRNILHKSAFDVLYNVGHENRAFINWEFLEKKMKKIENPIHWLHLFRFIDFSTVPKTQRMIRDCDAYLQRLGIADELIAANIGCQLLLLKNTNFISAKVGVNRLFLENGIPNAYEKAMEFFSMVADSAFDLTETTTVFCHIMQHSTVRTPELESQIQFLILRNDELSENFELKQKLRAASIRPRLRSKLTTMKKTDVNSLEEMDSFVSWCQAIRFPTVFSLHTKHKLYFLMSQIAEHVREPSVYIQTITNDTHVFEMLRTSVVQKPDHDILFKVITSLHLQDVPFKELQEFRCEYMNAFPKSQLNNMHLNDLLHLYVCAYQNPKVWKDIWKMIIPLLSHQVIRDVEKFTSEKPFNFGAVISILNQ